jgi:hypothetical protein
MKTRKILILAIALSVSTLTFAERIDIKGNTETWLQRNDDTGSLRAAPGIGGEDPTTNPIVPTPIGNAGGWMLALSMCYLGYVVIRKQQKCPHS